MKSIFLQIEFALVNYSFFYMPALSPFGNLLYKSHIFIFPKTILEKPILDIYKCPFSDFPKRSWLKKVKK
jgi:hypothetical protein